MPARPFLRGYGAGSGGEREDAQPSSRIPGRFVGQLPVDTGLAARTSSGVRLEFQGTAPAVQLRFAVGHAASRAIPTAPAAFSVWTGNRLYCQVPVSPGDMAVNVTLPARPEDETVLIYLPEPFLVQVETVSWLDGTLRPASRQPVWVVYGDSITQGWSVTDPGQAWPAIAGRELGLDVVNLGFAGAARGELPSAAQVAETPADLITLAWGTNCWAATAYDRDFIEQLYRMFLTTVRHGHPETEILVLSPIVRPAAEAARNPWGATLADLRAGIESAAEQYARDASDTHISLLRGRYLVTADLLADGIHPGDEGHARMAAAVVKALRDVLPPGP